MTSPTKEAKTPGPSFTQIDLSKTFFSPKDNKDDIAKKLEGRSLLMFLTNTETGASLLIPAATDYAYNAYFRNLIIEVNKSDLEPYNLTSIPLQDKQLVIILTDVPLTVSALMTLSMNDSYSLKGRVLQCFQIIEKFQAYTSLGNDLRFVFSAWLESLVQDNQRFWGKLRDNFPALFSIRKFRLELKRNQVKLGDLESMLKDKQEDKKERREILLRSSKVRQIVGTDEWKDVETMSDLPDESLKEEIKSDIDWKAQQGVPFPEEYAELGESNRQYADLYNAQFAAIKPADYQKYMTIEELMYIANNLLRLKEYAFIVRLWTVLAVNFDFYHFALNPGFFKLVDDVDIYAVKGKYMKPLVYLMYKEESNIRHDATTDMRHVMSLKQLEAMDWLVCPFALRNKSDLMIMPVSSFVLPWGHVTPKIPPRLANFNSYRNRLNTLMGGLLDVLEQDPVPDVYITGGINCLALIHSTFELIDWWNLETKSGKTLDEQVYYMQVKRKPSTGAIRNFVWNWKKLGDNLDYMKRLEEISYKDADIDIAIFADDDKDFIMKVGKVQLRLIERAKELKLDVKEGWQDVSQDKYRLKLPNGHSIEVFRMSRRKNPLGMIFDFHVPAVRSYYDPVKKDVFILPSCLWAAWTGFCLDLKYFASARDPLEIVYKYGIRGFQFLLNRFETGTISIYSRLSFNQDMNNAIRDRYVMPTVMTEFQEKYLKAINKAIARLLSRQGALSTSYVDRQMWSVKIKDGGVTTICKNFRYPDNIYAQPTPLQLGEDAPLETWIGLNKNSYLIEPRPAVPINPIPGEGKDVVKIWVTGLRDDVLPVVVAGNVQGVADKDTNPLGATVATMNFEGVNRQAFMVP